MSETRSIAVCVDDFGLHGGVNEAALELARRGRVSAVSALVDGPAWPSGADALRRGTPPVDVGLHVNLTERLGAAGPRHGLSRWILAAYTLGVDRTAIVPELHRQFDAFEAAMGRPPDFVDGHQHVHQLPGIREALLEVMDQRCPCSPRPWLRSTARPDRRRVPGVPLAARAKAWLIQSLGDRELRILGASRGYRLNAHLVGAYGFRATDEEYLEYLRGWLGAVVDGDLLFCHAAVDGPWSDSMLAARVREYRALGSDAFAALAARSGVVVRRQRSCCM